MKFALPAFLFAAAMLSTTAGQTTPATTDVDAIAVDAYIYAYPLVKVELTRRRLTNVVAPEGTQAPIGQFARLRTYPNASYRDVTAPNEMYWPKDSPPSILDGSWKIPPVKRAQ